MGGYGTWEMAMCYPEKFAAIAPICGGGDPYEIKNLKEIPAWVFHGDKDNTVPISEDQTMVDALKECGGNVEFTIYPDGTHDVWTETYNNPELYTWFLSHKKVNTADSPKHKEIIPDIKKLPDFKVAYNRAFGEGCEDKAYNEIKKFAEQNNLTDARYFGQSIDGDVAGGKTGYEKWVTVNNNVLPTEEIKIKNIKGGYYAVYTAGLNPQSIYKTYLNIGKWLKTNDYKFGFDNYMEEMVNRSGTNLFDVYVPFDNSNTNILMGTNDKGYLEHGNWRDYVGIRTSASREVHQIMQLGHRILNKRGYTKSPS
jgi:DNA gyrase inhibitor GyrI